MRRGEGLHADSKMGNQTSEWFPEGDQGWVLGGKLRNQKTPRREGHQGVSVQRSKTLLRGGHWEAENEQEKMEPGGQEARGGTYLKIAGGGRR